MAAALLAGVLLAFFAPALGPNTFVHRDTSRMHLPIKQWIGEELARGRLPQWNPYYALGTPVVAEAIDAPQHPFTALFVWFRPDIALKLWVLLSFAMAAGGMLAWARGLGLRWEGAVVAALTFALSGPVVSSTDNLTYLTAYAALPWAFAGLQRLLERGGTGAVAGVGVACALCAAAGDPQAWAIVLVSFPAYALAVRPRAEWRRALGRALAAMAAGVVASAPFILPVVLWLPFSDRGIGLESLDLRRWNLHLHRLPELVIPSLFRALDVTDPASPAYQAYLSDGLTGVPWFLSVYLGCSSVALAGVGARVDRRVRWLLVGAAVFLWAALGPSLGLGALLAHVPVVSSFRYWEKAVVWVALLAAPAAGVGADALDSPSTPRWIWRVTLLAAGFAFSLGLLGWWTPSLVARAAGGPADAAAALAQNLGRGGLQVGALLALLALAIGVAGRGTLGRTAPWMALGIVAADLLGGNGGAYLVGAPQPLDPPPLAAALRPDARVIAPFADREDRWPGEGRDVNIARWERRTLAPAWNVPLRIGTAEDYVGMREARWARLQPPNPADWKAQGRLGLFGFDVLVVPGDVRLAERVGLPGPAKVLGADPELPAWALEMPHRPRAYLAEEVVTGDAEAAFAFALEGGTAGRSIIEAPVAPGYARGGGAARIVSDFPGRTEIETQAAGVSLLVLNDAFAPGWSAEVDGMRAPIERANWLARGVWVPEGTHRVRFWYRTPGLLAGWAIALSGAVLLAARWLRRRGGRTRAIPSRAGGER